MDYQFICRCGFKIICIVGTVCMVGYWFYKFAAEDRDIGVVDYESFEESTNIHFPVVTFCFENIFLPHRMTETSQKINASGYEAGCMCSELLKNNDFKNLVDFTTYGAVFIQRERIQI